MKYNHPLLSAETIINDDVRNAQNENLGHIKDIMIDTANGQVKYYVLSFGGFLGMGDKYFAVPAKAMSVDTENKCMVLNVDKERLKQAPGFDKNNWPNMADKSFSDQVYNFYGDDFDDRMAA
tara:strand:- start:178 stop:543 length:366 start_codon:yes stop_codon:yes gene_type:complete